MDFEFTESERDLVISTVVNHVRGRVPVVVNTGAQASITAAVYSRRAEELGASAVMCMPPSPVSGSECRSYFKAISELGASGGLTGEKVMEINEKFDTKFLAAH